jgi:hypothetical protein
MQYCITIKNVSSTTQWCNLTYRKASLQNCFAGLLFCFARSSVNTATLHNHWYNCTNDGRYCTAARTNEPISRTVIQAGVQLYARLVQATESIVEFYHNTYNCTAIPKNLQNDSVMLQNHWYKSFFELIIQAQSFKKLSAIELHCHSPPKPQPLKGNFNIDFIVV